MTMQINVDPSGLTQSQRESLARFILAYPGKECAGTCGKGEHPTTVGKLALEVTMNTDKAKAAINDLAAHAQAANLPPVAADMLDPELNEVPSMFPPIVSAPEKAAVLDTSLAQDDAEFDASQAFSVHAASAIPSHDFDAAQAFGSTPAPLPLGAVAPSTAVAAPLPTAPVATLATTSTTPPPAPPVPAPTTSVAVPVPPAPAAPTNPVDLDKNGLPWDYRIHAESKAKIADGTWRKKRGADPAHVATVEAELRQLMGAPAPAAPGVAPSVPLPPAAPLAAHVTTLTAGPASLVVPAIATPTVTVPSPPSVPGVVSPTPAAPSAAVDPKAQFVQLVGKAAAAINAGKVTKEQVNAACAAHGVAQLVLLASRLDLVPTVAAEIYKLIGE